MSGGQLALVMAINRPNINHCGQKYILAFCVWLSSDLSLSLTSQPWLRPPRSQAPNETGQSGDEIVEPTHLSEHRLLLGVQLEDSEDTLENLTLD